MSGSINTNILTIITNSTSPAPKNTYNTTTTTTTTHTSTITTNSTATTTSNNPITVLTQILATEGAMSLWKGWLPRSCRAVGSGAIQFASYELTQNFMKSSSE
jgi:hypothetical protein